jgi:molybdenum cofactor biosynthesis enzyme MoaA
MTTKDKENKYEVVAYCKNCKRPRVIVNGLCPGCLQRGQIVFDSEINVLKEMAGK